LGPRMGASMVSRSLSCGRPPPRHNQYQHSRVQPLAQMNRGTGTIRSHNMGLGTAALTLFRGCRHRQMSWPMRYDYQYSYRVCTDCGIKRLFDPESFRNCGPYGYDLQELIAGDRARRMKQRKVTSLKSLLISD
jgi:hypothetical protein